MHYDKVDIRALQLRSFICITNTWTRVHCVNICAFKYARVNYVGICALRFCRCACITITWIYTCVQIAWARALHMRKSMAFLRGLYAFPLRVLTYITITL